jgi:hypothetical protein
LERVEDLNILNPKHGVKIAQALFASSFADKIKTKAEFPVINIKEDILVHNGKGKLVTAPTFMNTSRFRSAISQAFASELGLIDVDDLLWFQAESENEDLKAPVVEVKFRLKGKIIRTQMIVTKKLNKRQHKIELGRKDLKDFVIRFEE